MSYLDLITQQVGNYEVVYLGGDTPTEAPVSINPVQPILKSGDYINYEGQGEGNSWQWASSRTRWGTTSSPNGVYISFSAWVYFPVSETAKTAYLIGRGSTSYPSNAFPTIMVYSPTTGEGTPGGDIRVGGTVKASGIFEFEKWHHIAMRESNVFGDSELYVDGVLVSTGLSSSNYRNAILGHWANNVSPPAETPDPTGVRLDHFVMVAGLGTDPDGKRRGVMTPEHIAEQIEYFAAAEEVLETPVPATAAGEMLDAAFDNASHVSVSALAATASAMAGAPGVAGEINPGVRRLLAPLVTRLRTDGMPLIPDTNVSVSNTTADGTRSTLLFEVPRAEAIAGGGPAMKVTEEKFILRMTAHSVAGSDTGTISVRGININNDGSGAAWAGNPSNPQKQFVFGGSAQQQEWTFDTIPTGRWVAVSADFDVTFDSPVTDAGGDGSYFDITIDRITQANPATALANANMVSPDVSMFNSVSIGAVTATASAEMPGGYKPDAEFTVAPMDVSANMGWGYFRSDRRVFVVPAEAGGFMYESTDHRVEKEMIVNVSDPARARARSLEPAAVNDKEIDINLGDPYWNRVARRSTEGPLPPAATLWFRLNQREGTFAQRLNSEGVFVTNPPSGYINGYDIEGAFEWGAAGPNGKRGLWARDAVFGSAEQSFFDENTSKQQSVEYTVRVEPGHTGRMEIARGTARGWSGYPGPLRQFYTGIHDGRVYFAGKSIKRIDDGEWHHVVVTTAQVGTLIHFEIYIDGELDRTLTSNENVGGTQGFAPPAPPTRFLGGDTDYPFQGEILDIVTRAAPVLSHEVKELYLDMFGLKAARAGAPMTATADSYQGHKVISSMKRMLLISWMPVGSGEFQAQRIGSAAWNDKGFYERSITAASGQLGPMLGYGWDEEMDLGRYLVTVVQPDKVGSYNTALKPEVLEQNRSWMFVDKVTGRQRMLDLVNDVDLDQFDVIAFQSYPNKQYEDQYERQMNEAFLESVRTALVMGKKMWITDPYLAADLGLISDVEEVPTLGAMYSDGRIRRAMGYDDARRDVRGYEVAPFIGLNGGKHPKPANGALPSLYPAIPDGSQYGIHDIWSGDVHHNNGYRVVNEIEGLTDIPSWELDEMFWRDRTNMLPQNDDEYYHRGIRMENRTGIDYEWGPDDGSDNFPAKKESKGTGLKVGDEFYDYLNFDNAYHYFRRPSSPAAKYLRDGRVDSTWAIPPGHLKVGTPVTTFRSTLWNDYGDEIVNPYRNFIRNAVIRPGDRLPDGRKINGYAYMEFAEHPSFRGMAGVSWTKQLTGLPGEGPQGAKETEYSFDWDYVTTVRRSYTGGGSIPSTQIKFHYGPRSSNGVTQMASKGEKIEWLLPSAPTVAERYATISMPHQTWNSRGISWLTMVDVEDAEAALAHQDGSAQADAGMLSPMVDVEFDNEVSVEAAQASGRIVDPGETVIKSTNVLAYAATARGTMMGLPGGYKAEAATSFGYMPQNVRRPLDVEEVLFFTVSFTQETIYVRMEEN